MLPRNGSANHSPPPAPPGSAASEGFTHTHHHDSSALDGLFAQGPLDIDVLSELLGSLDSTTAPSTLAHYSTFAGDAATNLVVDAGDDADEDVDIDLESTDLPDYSGITTESVLFGLRSLDDFERQASIYTEGRAMPDDGTEDSEGATRASAMEIDTGYDCLTGLDLLQDLSDHTPSGSSIGLGSFNEAELSAALEQIYWSSLEMPLPVSSDVATHDGAGLSEAMSTMAAPTPTSTPVSHTMPTHSEPANIHLSSWVSSNGHYGHDNGITDIPDFAGGVDEQADGSGVEDDEDDEDDEDENPLELEELSLFSLFLSDMAAFESFLGNLSLNQLRQCAATVNSVLARRETTLSDTVRSAQSSTSRRQQKADGSSSVPIEPLTNSDIHMSSGNVCDETDWTAQLGDQSDHCTIATEPDREQSGACLPSTTLTLLREWLPPSTADCVITALQAANLAVPLASNSQSYSVATAGSSASSSKPRVSTLIASTQTRTGTMPSVAINRRVSNHYYSESTQTNEPLLETGGDDVPWLSFVYAQKGKPKRHRIRIDIERAPLPAIPSSFQANNCVYPRANCAKSAYTGNRWSYETECNGIGWKLAFLNQELLSGRRGLLQTAVNNYRTIVAGRKSRRIARLEKAERTQHASPACESRTTNTGRLPCTATSTSSNNKRSLPLPVSTTSMGHGEFDAQAETVATPGDKRAKLTHCHSDNTTASGGQTIPSHSVPSGTTVLPAAAIGGDGSICQPRIRVNDGATEPKSSENTADVVVSLSEDTPSSSSSIGTSALIAASVRVSGPSQTASTVASQNAKCLTINAYVNSKFSRIRINIDLGTVSSVAADTRFKNDHAVFPRALNTSRSRYGALQGRWEFEIACNELAWRLAWLNKGRLRGRKPLIQKCLDAYRIRFTTPPWSLLSCYRDQMSESVDPQFFDYWTPRPGRLRLNAEPVTSTQSPQEQVSVASSHYDSIIPPSHSTLSSGCLENSAGAMLPSSSNAPGSCATTKSSKVALRDTTMLESEAVEQPRVSGSTAVADENIASRLEPTSQHCLEPDVAGNAMAEPLKRSSSSSGSESAARMRIIRPKSGSGQATDIAQVVPVVLRPVGVPSIPAAPINGPVRPIVRPQSTLSVIAPAPGSQTRPLDSQPPAASRPVASSNTSVVGSMPSLSHSRPRPPPARSQAFVPKRSNVPAANVGNRPPTQPPMPTLQQISPNGRGVRPTTVLSTGESVAIPAPNQHSRPSQKLPASQLAVSPRPAPAKVVTGAKTPLPPRASANMQRDPHRRPAAASGEGLPQRSVTAPTSPPVVRRRHTDAPGSLAKLQPGRSSTSHPPVSSSIGPVTIGDAGAGTNRSSPSARIQATTKAHAQSSKGNMAIPPTAHGSGSEKSVKAQVAADMLTDVLRRLAKTDPSLAPLAGVLGKSQLELKSNKTCPAPRGGDDDGDDDDSPLDDKVAELEKLIIDLQNN